MRNYNYQSSPYGDTFDSRPCLLARECASPDFLSQFYSPSPVLAAQTLPVTELAHRLQQVNLQSPQNSGYEDYGYEIYTPCDEEEFPDSPPQLVYSLPSPPATPPARHNTPVGRRGDASSLLASPITEHYTFENTYKQEAYDSFRSDFFSPSPVFAPRPLPVTELANRFEKVNLQQQPSGYESYGYAGEYMQTPYLPPIEMQSPQLPRNTGFFSPSPAYFKNASLPAWNPAFTYDDDEVL